MLSALTEAGERPSLIHTGQHYGQGLSEVFFDQLGLPQPDRNLGVGSGSHGVQTAKLMTELDKVMEEIQPEWVVVYGDVNSTLAAALVASKRGVRVAHVEAGLRSFDRSMPEEINRIVTDTLAELHFTTSPEAARHLIDEGVDAAGIHHVGNPMIDSLVRVLDELDASSERRRFGLESAYAIATIHRPSNVDDPKAAVKLVGALEKVAQMVPVLLPLHPRGRNVLQAAGLMDLANVTVTEPLGYLEFVALVSEAAVVLTDSGGIQEETTFLGVPCVTLRRNTERPVTATLGTNRLVGSDPDAIYAAVGEVLADPPKGEVPPLWDGKAGRRIADVLRS